MPRTALAVQQTTQGLKLSNDETNRLTMWAADNWPEIVGLRGQDLRETLYWHGKQAVVDRAMLSAANVRDILAAVNAWRRPDFPINGNDALKAGFEGQDIGKALSRVGQAWVDSDFMLEREVLLGLLVQSQD